MHPHQPSRHPHLPDLCTTQVLDVRRGPETASSSGDGAAGSHEVLLKRRGYEVRRYSALPVAAATLPGGSAGAGEAGVYAAAEFGGEATAAAAAAAERALRWGDERGALLMGSLGKAGARAELLFLPSQRAGECHGRGPHDSPALREGSTRRTFAKQCGTTRASVFPPWLGLQARPPGGRAAAGGGRLGGGGPSRRGAAAAQERAAHPACLLCAVVMPMWLPPSPATATSCYNVNCLCCREACVVLHLQVLTCCTAAACDTTRPLLPPPTPMLATLGQCLPRQIP